VKFLADENVELGIVEYLRLSDNDVLYITEKSPGILDSAVIGLANKEKRVIITNDKDFGEIIFLQRKVSVGIILMRFGNENLSIKIASLKILLSKYNKKITGHFVVIDEERIRIRPIS